MHLTPILATKLYIPQPRPDFVRRPRLVDQLNHGLRCKLTLISAPAGFGKSMLVSEWLADCHRPAAWLSLDEGDCDPIRFLTYLTAALQRCAEDTTEGAGPSVGAAVLAALQAPQPPPFEALLTALINEIAAAPADPSSGLDQGFVLVLDDYHLIDAQPVDDALTFLLDNLPPQMHVVLATREDPNLPIARYRVRGQLTELRAVDLRFTPTEAATFLNETMGFSLSADEIAALERRTEGWIAGLQLAALSLQGQRGTGQQNTPDFIDSFTGSHRFVLDYLVAEVLHQQSEEVQAFLLHTSILDRLCGPLCDALLDAPPGTGQKALETLEQANLFVVPLDNERRWYRYHHLFADLLRQRLSQSVAPSTGTVQQQIVDLHLRASHWYEEQDLTNEALQHAAAAEDFVRMAELLERTWRTMNRSYRSAALLAWFKMLPEALVRNRPVLCSGFAWALLSCGQLEAGEARLQDAEQWLRIADVTKTQQADPRAAITNDALVVVDAEQFRALPATIATARAYRAQAVGDMAASVEYARQALDFTPEDDHFERGVAAALLGLAHWAAGDLAHADSSFAHGMEQMRLAGNILSAISGSFVLAGIKMAQGRLREAVGVYEDALRLARNGDEPVLRGTADLYAGLSELQRQQGDLAAAANSLRISNELGDQARLPEMQYRSRAVVMARMKEAQGDLDGALALLQEAERLHVRGPVPDVRPVSALKARLWIAQGRLAEAQDWAHQQRLPAGELSYLREFEHITLARLRIAQYRQERTDDPIREATALLQRLLAAAEAGDRIGSVIEILMLQALAHDAHGDADAALASLERALILAEPEGYVQLFVDEGLPMAHLLTAAAAREIAPNYVNNLLAAFGHEVPATAVNPPQSAVSAAQPLIEPLSERELEVLRLLAQGLSNREIGERLVIALDTVKGHNRRIYGKLEVKRRTEAVARARQLALL